MKKLNFIMIGLVMLLTSVNAQTKRTPRNLKQVILYLNKDCPDSLKSVIKETPDEKLKSLLYPWGGKYKTILQWKNDEESGITKYLTGKGVSSNQETVILIAFKQFLLGHKQAEEITLKPFQDIESKWKAEDLVRQMADSLRGIYIPKDLDDCFRQIDSFWSDSVRRVVKQLTERDFSSRYHLGFGAWMRNNWQLWGGSRLSAYFNEKGIYHAKDMSGIILDSYHRYLNGKAISLEEQVLYYKDYWEKSKRDNLAAKKEEFEKYHVGDIVLFNYKYGYSSLGQEEKNDKDICIARGQVLEKNEDKFLLKVMILESCDKKGIICLDSKYTLIFDPHSKRYVKPKKRVIKYLKTGQADWFNYEAWAVK